MTVTANGLPRRDTDIALCARIQARLSLQEAQLEVRYERGSSDWNQAMMEIRERSLEINGFEWLQMSTIPRYRLPARIQRTIVVYMRWHNVIEKGRRNKLQKIENLHDKLHVGQSLPPQLQRDFVRLCQSKIDNLIQARGRYWKTYGYFRFVGEETEWDESTIQWLEPKWNGKILPLRKKNIPRVFHRLPKQQQKDLVLHCIGSLPGEDRDELFSRCVSEIFQFKGGNSYWLNSTTLQLARQTPTSPRPLRIPPTPR